MATLDAGLWSFLQHFEIEPHLVKEQFTGFRIAALRPPAYWQGVDLRLGDVVSRVNGMPIERPEQMVSAFSSLRTASDLRVALVREGAPHQIVYRIIARASASPTSTKAPAQSTKARRMKPRAVPPSGGGTEADEPARNTLKTP